MWFLRCESALKYVYSWAAILLVLLCMRCHNDTGMLPQLCSVRVLYC